MQTTIKISKQTLAEIKKIGYMGETYEDVILRLLKKQRKKETKEEKPEYIDKLNGTNSKRRR
jgi:hypothetical protein|tara:strand:- start:875 stop:1060 length:186 start_codon:yes stop_codon:yes gene_type:complete